MRNVRKPEVPADPPSASPRPWQRRRYRVAAVGVAAVVGVGAVLAHQVGPASSTVASDNASDTPSEAASATGSPSATVSTSTSPSASAKPSASPSESPPPTASPMAAKKAPDDIPVNESTVTRDGRTLRIVSARADLTGQRELTWAADTGHPVGSARCTQNFQFSPNSPAGVRPTMLLCWRTSAHKSVYVIETNPGGRPSESEAVAALNHEWFRLG